MIKSQRLERLFPIARLKRKELCPDLYRSKSPPSPSPETPSLPAAEASAILKKIIHVYNLCHLPQLLPAARGSPTLPNHRLGNLSLLANIASIFFCCSFIAINNISLVDIAAESLKLFVVKVSEFFAE